MFKFNFKNLKKFFVLTMASILCLLIFSVGWVVYQKSSNRPLIPTVQAGEGFVPVNLPIRVAFPYPGAKLVDIKNHFSITPATAGDLSFDGRVLTFHHEKNLKYDTVYTITISQGVKIGLGRRLTEDITLTFSTRPRSEKGILELSPYGTFRNFRFYNLNYYDHQYEIFLRFRLYRLYSGGVFTFKIYKSSPEKLLEAYFQPQAYDETTGELIPKNYAEGEPIDVQQLMIGEEESVLVPKISEIGIYYVEVLFPETGKEFSNFFLALTKNAVLTKRLGDGLVTWVVNKKTSAAVSNVQVTAIGSKPDEILFQNNTNDQGLVENIVKQEDENQQPLIIKVTDGVDLTYNFLEMNNIYFTDYSNRLKLYHAYLYTDRPIYQPGDKVNFKMILRENNKEFYRPVVKEVLIRAEELSYSENRNVIFEQKMTTNEKGSLAGSFDLSHELKSGVYQMLVELDGEILTKVVFNVEFYQKPDFEILISLDKDQYIRGEIAKAKISAKYFFGDPLKGVKFNWRVHTFDNSTLIEGEGQFDNFGISTLDFPTKDISWWFRADNLTVTLEVSITDKSGRVSSARRTATLFNSEFKITLTQPKNLWNFKSKQSYNFVVKAEENLTQNPKGGLALKAVFKKTNWWAEDEKEREKIIKEADLTTDNFGEARFEMNFPTAGGGYYYLEVSGVGQDNYQNDLKKIFYFWVSEESLAGIQQNKKEFADHILISFDQKSYQIGEVAKIDLQLPRPAGDIWWSVNKQTFKKLGVDKLNGYKKSLEIPITEDLVPGFYLQVNLFQDEFFIIASQLIEIEGKKLKVEVVSAKSEAGPGEDFEIVLKTADENGYPVSADGSLSIIDKAIFALKSDQTADIFDTFYPKPEDWWAENVYSITPISDYADYGRGCFLAGTKILMADQSYKKIEEIKVGDYILTKENEVSKKLVKDKVTRVFEHWSNEYLIVTHEKGRLLVTDIHPILVNDGWKDARDIRLGDKLMTSQNEKVKVLGVEKVKTQKPVKVYNFQTLNYHTFFADGIYVHNQCSEKGGSDETCPIRANFVDTAYWNAWVETDQKGQATVKFKLPDNLTTWVAFFRAVTPATQVGQNNVSFKVTKNLIIRPVVPQFFRNNDKTTLISAIHNNLGTLTKFRAYLKTEGAVLVDQPIKEIEIENGEVKNVLWQLQIGKEQSVKLTWLVEEINGQARDGVELTLPVYSNLSLDKKVFTGQAETQVDFAYEPETSRVRSSVSFSLISSVLGILPEVIEKLTGYPYGCVEQTMSRHLPNILVYKEKAVLGLKPPVDLEKKLTDGFERLVKFQHDDGGFGWWETDESNIWMSGYVLEGLFEAKQVGLLAGKEGIYSKLLDYLKNNVANFKEDERIYISYVLSKVEPGSNKKWVEKFADEFLAGKSFDPQNQGYLALGLYYNGNLEKARIVLDKILSQLQVDHWEMPKDWENWESLKDRYSATGVNLLALLKIDEKNAVVPKIVQWLMHNRMGYEGLWGSTRQSIQILLALVEYIKKTDELNPDFVYDVFLNGELIKNDQVKDRRYALKMDLPIDKIKVINRLEVKQRGKGNIYWTLTLKNYLAGEKIAGTDPGIKISREYLDFKGKVITKFIPGTLVRVRINVQNEKEVNYIILEDYLPAAFEVQNMRLENVGGTAKLGDMYFGDWYDYQDIRDEKVVIFKNYLWPGVHTFEYLVRVSQSGEFEAPAPRLELMYSPEVFSLGKSSKILVE